MFHANTERLIEDWRARRAGRIAPARADISPDEFRDILPQLFILGHEGGPAEPFRLAGGLLVDLHDRELRGVCFLSLWPQPDREQVREALEEACRTGAPAVLAASAWAADGSETRLEIVLAPLIGPSGEVDRIFGLYQPTTSVRRLMGQPVQELSLRDVEVADRGWSQPRPPGRDRSRLKLVALDGKRVD